MKKIYHLGLLFLVFLSFNKSTAQNFSPDIVVDINGTGNFTSLQAAFDAVPANSTKETIIYIKRGLYNQEKLIIPANKPNITLIGESREQTIISYDTYNCSDGGDGMCPDAKVALWASNSDLVRTAATLTIIANNFKAENITIQNTAGNVGQAQALTIQSDRNVFINCNITGYQDTIYFWMGATSRAYFESCMILGRTDYIYGGGIAFFNKCEIRSYGGAWITAPSTGADQEYGFVFYKCNLTYQPNSPRNGDDGAKIKFGRPWHNYPKVSWLYCTMPAEIDPLGWGDKWNMTYSDTDPRLRLYEWMNTGSGADMSGRANWVGLRAMADQTEANLYEPKNILKGTDNWDPTAIAPTVTVYNWDGGAASTGWMEANNWNPNGTPAASEVANVDGNVTINANGGSFNADLNLANSTTIDVSANSSATLLSLNQSILSSSATATLSGNVKTKGMVSINVSGNLNLAAALSGIHQITKLGTGISQLNGNNSGYTGNLVIEAGEVQAKVANSLGKSPKITLKTNGKLTVDVSNAVDVKTALYTEGTALLVLNQDITINQWYIDGVLQPIGQYNASTNPATISGPGKIIIGRPSEFLFIGGTTNGNWDNAAHYSPALLPLAGEKVIVNGLSIEAQSTAFAGDMYVQNGGAIRLRRTDSKCLGTVRMFQNTNINYATSSTGLSLNAPIILEGDILLLLNSSSVTGSVMDLPGTFTGGYKITVQNTRNVVNSATANLGGNNIGFTGIWNLNVAAANADGYSAINGMVANAFGNGIIDLAFKNKAIFNHEKCAGDILNIKITGSASAILNVAVKVKEFTLNGTKLADGKYDATTHTGLLTGTGSITVNSTSLSVDNHVFLKHGILRVNGNLENLEVFSLTGQRVFQTTLATEIDLNNLKSGFYIVRYKIDGKVGATKICKK
jgi:autotransporter-associated beta strand protein